MGREKSSCIIAKSTFSRSASCGERSSPIAQKRAKTSAGRGASRQARQEKSRKKNEAISPSLETACSPFFRRSGRNAEEALCAMCSAE